MYGLIDDDTPDFKPCERTVRLCIEALPYPGSNQSYRSALQALLPDPAKALVEKWEETGCHIPKGRTAYEAFAQFLIDTGRIRSGE